VITSVIWLPASLLAGLFQAWRTAVQQRLREDLTVSGASLVRYLYGLPVAIFLIIADALARGPFGPKLGFAFYLLAGAGGLTQILATNLLIMAFGYRNFVVGTAFSKTEAVQAAVFAWLAFGEHLSVLAWAGIGMGVAGVLVLALAAQKLRAREILRSLGQPAALCGLSAGALFAVTGLLVKRATAELSLSDPVSGALVTLAAVMLLQIVMHGAYIAWREPKTLRDVLVTWRTSSQVGILAGLGSACWFTGFASAPVALVRIVGQVEVIFTLAFARLYLREKIRPHDALGLFMVSGGVVLALLGGRVES
jgi:drug/metabolite transporter (DMT)-like permease